MGNKKQVKEERNRGGLKKRKAVKSFGEGLGDWGVGFGDEEVDQESVRQLRAQVLVWVIESKLKE